MYMYNASSTGLNILLPEWAKEGGHDKMMELLQIKDKRQQMMDEVDFYVPPEKILLVGFKNENLRNLIGKTLAEVSSERNISPNEAIVDLIYEDDSRIQVVYFSMSEDNIKKSWHFRTCPFVLMPGHTLPKEYFYYKVHIQERTDHLPGYWAIMCVKRT